MNLRNYLLVLFIVGGLVITPAATAYEPSGTIKLIAYSDLEQGERLFPGSLVNLTFVLKNFTNETMRMVNVTHSIPEDMQLYMAPAGVLLNSSSELNVTSSFSYETPTNGSVTLTRAYINSTYYELSFEKLLPSQSFSWMITLNASDALTFEVSSPTVKYLDKWGDEKTFSDANPLSLRYETPDEEDPSEKNYPTFETADANWTLIISVMVLVAVVAVFSKALYGKKPF